MESVRNDMAISQRPPPRKGREREWPAVDPKLVLGASDF
jgi:hypothetical protein